MEEDDLNIAVGDKLEQEGNNLEDEYGYEDEEFVGQEDEQNEDNNNNQKENEEKDDDEEEEEEAEGEDDEEEEEEEEENEQEGSNSNDENNNNEENHNEYDFGGEESPQRTGGRIRVTKKIKSGAVSDDDDDNDDEEEDNQGDEEEEDDDDLDNNNDGQEMEQEGSRGKVMSRQVGKRGRETRMTQSPQSPTKDPLASKQTGQVQEDEEDEDEENDNDADQDEDMEDDGDEDDEDDDMDDMEDSKNKQKDSGSQNENDQNNEGNENNNQRRGTGSLKDKKRKKNEFWKFRHKNKEEQLRQPQQRVGLSKVSNQIGAVIQSSLTAAKPIEEPPAVNNQISNSSHIVSHNVNSTAKLSSFDEQESLKYALERAAKFNLEILSQKMRVQEILRFHEKNKQQQSRPMLLEHWTSTTLFPSNVPVEAVTEEGCKYLLNVPAFCQKSTLDDFVHKNVQQEHTDMLADLQKFGIKKQPLNKNKNIKKKLTKKSTFGADLYN